MRTERDTARESVDAPMCSMVVDWPDAHAYQAEILLLTLGELAGVPRERSAVLSARRGSAAKSSRNSSVGDMRRR